MKHFKSLAATLTGAILLSSAPLSATPLSSAVNGAVLKSHVTDGSSLIDVQFRRRRSSGAAAAIVAGAIIGGIIASQAGPVYPYGSYYPAYGLYPAYPYSPPYVVYRAYPAPAYDAAIAYCIRRFRSYDPYTRTYLGYDGRRHGCP